MKKNFYLVAKRSHAGFSMPFFSRLFCRQAGSLLSNKVIIIAFFSIFFINKIFAVPVSANPGNALKLNGTLSFRNVNSMLSTASPSLSFKESAKSGRNNLNIFRPMDPTTLKSLRTNLYLLNNDGSTILADGNLVQFDDGYSATVDMNDAIKFTNMDETLGILNGTISLAIERRPTIANNDSLLYKLTRTRQRKYRLEFVANNLYRDNLTGFIEDRFLNSVTPVSLNGNTIVDFEVNANAASAAAGRFRIVFKPSASFAVITATVLNSDIAVEWTVPNEYNIKEYEIEHSTNGIDFSTIATVASFGNNDNAVTYNWLHVAPALGYHYYRIRSVSNNNVTVYSKVVNVKINRSTPAIYVFPNPVTEKFIQLQMNKLPQGVYNTSLYNSRGQLVSTGKITHAAGTSTATIPMRQKLPLGIYELVVTAPDKKVTVIKVLLN